MACSGLNIPASQNSSIYVFDNVFADIGDVLCFFCWGGGLRGWFLLLFFGY